MICDGINSCSFVYRLGTGPHSVSGDGQLQMITGAVYYWVIPPLRLPTDCPQQGACFYQANKFLFLHFYVVMYFFFCSNVSQRMLCKVSGVSNVPLLRLSCLKLDVAVLRVPQVQPLTTGAPSIPALSSRRITSFSDTSHFFLPVPLSHLKQIPFTYSECVLRCIFQFHLVQV